MRAYRAEYTAKHGDGGASREDDPNFKLASSKSPSYIDSVKNNGEKNTTMIPDTSKNRKENLLFFLFCFTF
jgi:hypothetical protein